MWEYFVQTSDGRVRQMSEASLRSKLRRGKFTGLELARRADDPSWRKLGELHLYSQEVAFEGDPIDHARHKTVNGWMVHALVFLAVNVVTGFPTPLLIFWGLGVFMHGRNRNVLHHAKILNEAGRLPVIGSWNGKKPQALPAGQTAYQSGGTVPPMAPAPQAGPPVAPAALIPAAPAPLPARATGPSEIGYEPTVGRTRNASTTGRDLEQRQLEASVRGKLFGSESTAPVQIGRYRLGERLGAGGMGIVFAAQDTSLDRPVALKLLRPGYEMDAAAERLQREARAMARLSHPNVVTVFDVGTHEGAVFVAMEKVEGGTLRDWLREPRPTADIIDVLDQAAGGLGAAHGAGLVHRDFKPENVMVGNDGRVRVLDFGLAKPSDPGNTADLLTQTGTMLGTPRYMAPEQFRGEDADARSDQFALGVVFYEALYGVHPYQPKDDRPLPRAVLAGKLRDTPIRIDIPPAVRTAVLRAVAHDSDARFDSVEALAEALGPRPTTSDGLASLAAASRRLLSRRPAEQAAPLLKALDDLERTVATLDERVATLLRQAPSSEREEVERELNLAQVAFDSATADDELSLFASQRDALRDRIEGLEAAHGMLGKLRTRRGIAQTQLEQLHLDLVRAQASDTADLPDLTGPLQELRFQVDAAAEVEELLQR
ncbi:MAG: protein kinase domain-containing protein [Nannocystales bacterium]